MRMPNNVSAKHKRMIAELQEEGFHIVPPGYKQCQQCEKPRSIREGNYYLSFSKMNKADGLMHICKNCMEENFTRYMGEYNGDERQAIYRLCQDVDSVWNLAAYEAAHASKTKTWKTFFKNINSLSHTQGLSFDSSDPFNMSSSELKEKQDVESGKLKLSRAEKKARDEIIEAIGRDPYAEFSLPDQKALYPELIEYLDEDTQENPFLVGQIIQITINNNTIQKLNETLSRITRDISQLEKNQDKIKNMTNVIKNVSQTTINIAKENGIAKKGGESKKRSTLTGMMTYYRDLNLEEIEVDYYDQITSIGMERVNKLSMKAIFEQGLFSDNDFAEMLQHSRSLVEELSGKVLNLEEENRRLKSLMDKNGLNYKEGVSIE